MKQALGVSQFIDACNPPPDTLTRGLDSESFQDREAGMKSCWQNCGQSAGTFPSVFQHMIASGTDLILSEHDLVFTCLLFLQLIKALNAFPEKALAETQRILS